MNVYWSRCGPREGNFGDKLTPLLLRRFGLRSDWTPPGQAQLIGVGSLMEKIPESFPGVIWSSGFMQADSRKAFPQANVMAVRGRLTLERIECRDKQRICLGDGGLLSHLFFQPVKKKFQLGFIPHFVDFEDPVVAELQSRHPATTVIDVCRPPRSVIQAVGECETILSSSLHGLVVADSLGIPNRWMELNRGQEKVWGAGFKFRDYYSVFDLEDVAPFRPTTADNLNTLLAAVGNCRRPGIESIQQRLLQNLEQVANALRPADPHQAAHEMAVKEAWMGRLPGALEQLKRMIPTDARYLCVDDDQLRHAMADARAIPFLERNGEYWGPPADDDTAIRDLERLRQAGASFAVFAWPAFWWLAHYVNFHDYLRTTFQQVHKDSDWIIFDLRVK